MSARRRVTSGYFRTPNSIIENASAFTHAELVLALTILRRGGPNADVKISTSNWTSWTGLSERALEYAAAGLRKKCLQMNGKGNKAQYRFEMAAWETFVSSAVKAKTRTTGRTLRAVAPRKGAMVHPGCRDRGCAMLAVEEQSKVLNHCDSTQFAQPVAQITGPAGGNPGWEIRTAGSGNNGGDFKLIPFPTTQVAQPVAQNTPADPAVQLWPKTLEALQACFPLVESPFLVRLVGVVCADHRNVTDAELAESVGLAWKWKRKVQKGEGLFLLTVPAAVAALRRVPKTAPGPDVADGVRRMVDAAIVALQVHGDVFETALGELRQISGELDRGIDYERTESHMEKIETSIVRIGAGLVSRQDADQAAERAVHDYKLKRDPHGADILPLTVVEDVRKGAWSKRVLELLNCPRLSLFYA